MLEELVSVLERVGYEYQCCVEGHIELEYYFLQNKVFSSFS